MAAGANVSGTLRVPPEKNGTRSVPDTTLLNGDLAIDARVVTMDDILGRLATIRRVTVSRKAIVTPAVQDELLRRGIDLVRADSRNGKTVAAPRVALICSGVDFDPQPLVAALRAKA